MKQSEQTEDAVLRVELVRAALRTALKGLEYLPGDEELATVADLSERRLSFVSGPAGKQGSTAY